MLRPPPTASSSNSKGVPIGNLTSQLFANIYLNELDQFVKHKLKVWYYARYTDDFVIISESREYLESLLPPIEEFLKIKLELKLHPDKISIRKFHQGIDFLGYVILPHHRQLRTKTRRRIFKKLRRRIDQYNRREITEDTLTSSLQSYLGVLSHADSFQLSQEIKNQFWFWKN